MRAPGLSDRFPIGTRVRLSEIGRRLCPPRAPIGTIVGYSRTYTSLRVARDGRAYPISSHPDHWVTITRITPNDQPAIEEHW